ncbi:hypothetical protein PENSPDRAFT_757753 [Peniophora sp. CONT]|nr:hypothetical protein PENSPDRAFT_757753 [Peniophora sp. CONT]
MDIYKQLSDVEAVPASDFWLPIARQRLAGYHTQMTSANIPRSSERFAELSHAMRAEASVLEQIIKLFVAQWDADVPIINSLPPEILHYIFSLVAEIDRPHPPYVCLARDADHIRVCRLTDGFQHDRNSERRYPALGKGGYLGWIRLGHVCQSWRNALLGFPALWASDTGLLPRGTHTMLERAQNMPLSIRAYLSACRPEAGRAVLSAMAAQPMSDLVLRARELDIIDVRATHLQHLDAFFDRCTFPLVEHATVVGELDRPGVGHIRPLRYLATINAPRLRSLHLIMAFYPWSSSVLSSLSIGTAGEVFEDRGLDVDAQHIDYIMQASATTLKDLSLTGLWLVDDDDGRRTRPNAPGPTLPKLQSLRIHTALNSFRDWTVYSWILASTSLPLTARLMVRVTKAEAEADPDTICAAINDCMMAKQACHLNALAIVDEPLLDTPRSDCDYLSIALYPEGIDPPPPSYGSTDTETLTHSPLVFVGEYRNQNDTQFVSEFLDALSTAPVLPELSTITVSFHYNQNLTISAPLLSASKNVRTVSLRALGCGTDWDSDKLGESWRNCTDVLKGPVLPRLERLALHDIVDLQGLPDIFRSRLRSLEEAGHTPSKLRELQLNVLRKAEEVSWEQDGDDAVLVSTLHEFADSVVLLRM